MYRYRNDGDEVFERRADLLSEFEEASAFAVCYGDAGGQFIPQNPILRLEVFDNLGQLAVGCGGEKSEQRLQESHDVPSVQCGSDSLGFRGKDKVFVHRRVRPVKK